MKIFRKFFRGPQKEYEYLKKIKEEVAGAFEKSLSYPNYPINLFYGQYFLSKIFSNYFAPYLLDPILKKKKLPCPILEIGAFITRIAELLPEEYKKQFIISDINLDILKFNPKDYPKISLNFQNLPFKDKKFPIIIGTNVFAHVLGLGQLEEIKRVLEDDGKIIFIEDLAMYAPGISLFFESLGKKSFYTYDPATRSIKCYLFTEDKLRKLSKEISNFFKTSTDVENFIQQLKEAQAPETLINSFEEFSEFLKTKKYFHSFELSTLIMSLTQNLFISLYQFNLPDNLIYSFQNFLVLLNNLLEKYSEKVITNWEDLLKDEDFQKFLNKKGLKINYEFVTAESNKEELVKWQEKVLKKFDPGLLTQICPFWQEFLETRNRILNELGLEIGALGEKYNIEAGNIKYKALVITLEPV